MKEGNVEKECPLYRTISQAPLCDELKLHLAKVNIYTKLHTAQETVPNMDFVQSRQPDFPKIRQCII